MTINELLDGYRGCVPSGVRYRPRTWIRALDLVAAPADVLAVLADDEFTTAAVAHAGDRVVGRDDLERMFDDLDVSDDHELLRTFLLVQAWGTGTSGSRTVRHTGVAFRHADVLVGNLRHAAETLRAASTPDALAVAYDEWTAPGVGRSFFTKWFAHAGRVPSRDWQPLILDQRVLRTLNDTLGYSTQALAGTSHWPRRYQAYVELVHTWAREDDDPATAAWVEWVLFKHNGAAALPDRTN